MNQNKTPQKGRLKIKAKTAALKKGLGCVILALRLPTISFSTDDSSSSSEGSKVSLKANEELIDSI
jgi:hypothetical protein